MNRRAAGFTLIEMMAVVVIVAILSTIAVPAYSDYVRGVSIREAFVHLTALGDLERRHWNDAGDSRPVACAIGGTPPPGEHFNYTCVVSPVQHGYVITARGQGDLRDYVFTIDVRGNRATVGYPGVSGLPAPCWLDRPGNCY